MNIYDSLFSSSDMLNEQIAGQMSDSVSDEGPFIAVRDAKGKYWISDEDRFRKFVPEGKILAQTISKIDDGFDPVIEKTKNCTFVVTHLSAEQIKCGYLFVVLPGYTAETTLANIEIIELLLAQVELIARLIEKNNQLYHFQLQQLSDTSSNPSPVPR